MPTPNPSSEHAGRTDPAERLADRITTAEASYLEGALDNPALDEERVVALLRNRRAQAGTLRRIHEDGRFRTSLRVRVGLVRHPWTPRTIAMNLVPYLRWRDLAQVADHLLTPGPVRQSAARTLESRLEEMATGEQTFLARTSGRTVLGLLARRASAAVVPAVLENPRLTEADLVAICSHRRTSPAVLALIARDPKWTCRYPVRLALVNHQKAPVGVILGLLSGLLSPDLEEIRTRPDRPPVVRMAARRVLARRYGPSGGVRRQPDVYVIETEESEPEPGG